jgi:hypothetical protein
LVLVSAEIFGIGMSFGFGLYSGFGRSPGREGWLGQMFFIIIIIMQIVKIPTGRKHFRIKMSFFWDKKVKIFF